MKSLLILMLSAPLSLAFAADEGGLKNESTLSYVVTGGNSSSETSSLKQNSSYTWSKDLLKFTGHYLKGSGRAVASATDPDPQNELTARNWSAALRYEKSITPNKFSAYLSHGWRGDRFQNVKEAHDSDIGGKYIWVKDDWNHFFTELGYRYTRELYYEVGLKADGTLEPIHPEFHFARLFNQYEYTHSKTLKLGLWVEWLPGLNNFTQNQRINYSPYLTSVLTDMFSLKVAYEGRYRFPAASSGLKYEDFTFTTSLIANY